jgi:sarcosine oxidase, subunit beta
MHYTNPHDVALAHRSIPYFQHWGDLVGAGDPGFVKAGVVRLIAPGQEPQLRANVAMMRALGVDTFLVGPKELRELDPWICVDDVELAAYEPESGYANPSATANGFAQRARELGVDIRLGLPATRVLAERNRVVGVETPEGRIATRSVVLATGAWTDPLLAPLGIELGLQVNRIQVVIFRRPDGAPVRHPVYIDGLRAMWVKPEGTHDVLSGYSVDRLGVDPDFFNESVDWDFVVASRNRLAALMPAFADSPMRGGWSGVVSMSPDGHAIIDHLPQCTGLYCFAGDSGTNFKTAPAIGKCLAEWIIDGAPRTVDLRALRSTRFADDAPVGGGAEYGTGPLDIFR